MISQKKNIALFLLGIFIFPFIFQPIHIIGHHNIINQEEQGFDNVQKSEHITDNSNLITLINDNSCPILKYQFSVNELSKISVIRFTLPEIEKPLCIIEEQQIKQQVIAFSSPRAPPV